MGYGLKCDITLFSSSALPGSLVFNPINAGLVLKFGWRVAFRVASGIILVTGLACCWTFTSKATPNMERLEEEDSQPSTPKVEVHEVYIMYTLVTCLFPKRFFISSLHLVKVTISQSNYIA